MIPRPLFFMQAFACLCLLALLTACGKRADKMEAPVGDDPKAYPRHYPDIALDPQGTYVPPAQK